MCVRIGSTVSNEARNSAAAGPKNTTVPIGNVTYAAVAEGTAAAPKTRDPRSGSASAATAATAPMRAGQSVQADHSKKQQNRASRRPRAQAYGEQHEMWMKCYESFNAEYRHATFNKCLDNFERKQNIEKDALQLMATSYRTKMCKHAIDDCPDGRTCQYAHDENDLDLWTQCRRMHDGVARAYRDDANPMLIPCYYHFKMRQCRNSNRCIFSHDEASLDQ